MDYVLVLQLQLSWYGCVSLKILILDVKNKVFTCTNCSYRSPSLMGDWSAIVKLKRMCICYQSVVRWCSLLNCSFFLMKLQSGFEV